MDPVKKLDEMLTEAGIPHEYYVEKYRDAERPQGTARMIFCEADEYSLNQVVYGRYDDDLWKISAIWQRGSYGRVGHLLEVYGTMTGTSPRVHTTEEVFRMIEADWKKQ